MVKEVVQNEEISLKGVLEGEGGEEYLGGGGGGAA